MRASSLIDLGMGAGRLALQAFLECPYLHTVVGVEIAASRWSLGCAAIERLAAAFPMRFALSRSATETSESVILEETIYGIQGYTRAGAGGGAGPRKLEFRRGDLFDCTSELATAEVVVLQTCLPPLIWGRTAKLLLNHANACLRLVS